MKRIRANLSYANIVATLALVLAVGGASAFAAGQLAKNSVGSKQLKRNAVTTAKIKKGAVTAAKIKNGAITGSKINLSTLGTVPSAQNANTLGGIGASGFSRAAFSAIDDEALSGEEGVAREVTITAPQNGFLLAIGSADVFNFTNTDFYSCLFYIDGVEQPQSVRSSELLEGNEEEDCGTNAIFPVNAGPHNVQFFFEGVNANTTVDETELDVVFIPLAG